MSDDRLPRPTIDVDRRGLLKAGAVGLTGIAAGLVSSQSNSGTTSVGGAADDQSAVPVENILVILNSERHTVGSETYEGADIRDGGELSLEDGSTLTLEPTPA